MNFNILVAMVPNAEEEVVDYATLDPNALNSNYDKNERIVNYELNEIVKTVEPLKISL